MEFDYNRDLSYQVYIPMTQQPSVEEELALADENVQVVVEEEENRSHPLIQPERVIASQQSQRVRMQKYHLDQEQINRQARPLTVDESGVRRRDFLEPLQEEPEGMEDVDEDLYNRLDSSPQMETRSYRADSIRAGSQPNVLLMNSF